MGLNSYIAKQLSKPNGCGGKIVFAVMNRQNRPMYEETERLLSLSASDYVLDIGCGNGYVLNLLANRYSCVFTGIDISESMLKTASHHNHKFLESGNMRLSLQNAEAMSFANDSFDKVYTVNTVYFWDNLERVMTEIRRVMKLNGLFINTLYSNETLDRFSHTKFGYKRFTTEQIRNASERAGFMVTTIPIIHGAAYCVICKSI